MGGREGTFKLSDKDKDWFKVAKLTQDQSEGLLSEMKKLKEDWANINQSHENFLVSAENMLGITNTIKIHREEAFVREGLPVEELDWSDLVAEANERYSDDIQFEDLLSEAEFSEAYGRLAEIDKEFAEKTGLRKKDLAFLGIALALQCVRQYILDPWLKKNRSGATANDEKGRKNNTDAGWYYVETEKILTNRVPYDVQQYGDNSTIQGFLKGGDHRSMTLGHDPIFGWIFGTANIMTSTVTRTDFISAHVKCINNTNKIHSLANTVTLFSKVIERVSKKGIDGKLALASAIARQFIHLKSDIYTKRGLPIPGISILSPELSRTLAQYGIDIAGIATEASLSCLINTIISMVHRLYIDEEQGGEQFFEVRTRKIILYSNLLASTSNIIASKLSGQYDLLDIGGALVTITRLVSDVRFICKVKDEFVQSKQDIQFEGIKSELDAIYKNRFGKEELAY